MINLTYHIVIGHRMCTEHGNHLPFILTLQITASAGQTLLNLDVSNCLSLTDQCCTSIAHNCKVLEVLGLTNLKEIKGDDLCRFFHNEERAKQFRAIMLSGSKNVRQSSCILNSWFFQDDQGSMEGKPRGVWGMFLKD